MGSDTDGAGGSDTDGSIVGLQTMQVHGSDTDGSRVNSGSETDGS